MKVAFISFSLATKLLRTRQSLQLLHSSEIPKNNVVKIIYCTVVMPHSNVAYMPKLPFVRVCLKLSLTSLHNVSNAISV